MIYVTISISILSKGIFQKEKGNDSTLLIIFIEQNSTNLLLWPPICRNERESLQSATTPRRLTLCQPPWLCFPNQKCPWSFFNLLQNQKSIFSSCSAIINSYSSSIILKLLFQNYLSVISSRGLFAYKWTNVGY